MVKKSAHRDLFIAAITREREGRIIDRQQVQEIMARIASAESRPTRHRV